MSMFSTVLGSPMDLGRAAPAPAADAADAVARTVRPAAAWP